MRRNVRFVALLDTERTKVVGPTARLHRHDARWEARQESLEPMALDAFTQDNRAIPIKPRNAAGRLPQINAQYCDLHRNAPLPPLFPQQWLRSWREGSSSH